MRKPYCKMSLKDLLEYLDSLNQAPGEEDHLPEQSHESLAVRPIQSFQQAQIAKETQILSLMMRGGRHNPGKN